MRLSSKKGFSFVEMMVVLAIIGIFLTFSAQKLVNPGTEMKAAVRRFSTTIKRLRNRARIENKTFRLVFDLPPDKKKDQSYWVESTEKQALLLNEEQREELEENLEENEQKQKPDPQGFGADTSVVKKAPSYLPRGLFFESIELDGKDIENIESGRIYIYFFPKVLSKEVLFTSLTEKNSTGLLELNHSQDKLIFLIHEKT